MIDREKAIELKDNVIKELQSINLDSYCLDKADKRISQYIEMCIAEPTLHNLYELLSIKRFLSFLDKYEFRIKAIKKFIKFYESLYFSGLKGRTRYRMTPVQVFQFSCILGFYYSGTDKRVCRDALLFVPRKYSKTTSVASLAIWDMLFGDANAQAYVAANSYEQAKICFDEIRDILKTLDPHFRHFKINRERIYNKRPGKTSFARCLASNPDKLDGLNASTIILDEYSQADSAELRNVLTSSMGARINPLTITITTASEKIESPFVTMLESYKSVLRGEIDNDSVFAHIFEPDVDDEEGDPLTWKKVHPHLGVTVQSDFYKSEYKKAIMSAEDMLTFRTKLLNIFSVNENEVWFHPDKIREIMNNIKIKNIKGNPQGVCAVDLSVKDDFSCAGYGMYDYNQKKFHIHLDFYIPEILLTTHPNKELYKNWVDQGYLKICGKTVIDYGIICNDIIENSKYITFLAIGYDPYKSLEFVNMMASSGASKVLRAVPQTNGAFTSPVETIELSVELQRLTFNENPIIAYCFGNAIMDIDKMENRKPIKKSKNQKIDGAIVATMIMYLFNNIER